MPKKKIRQAPPKPKPCYITDSKNMPLLYMDGLMTEGVKVLVRDSVSNPSPSFPTFPSHKAAHKAVYDTMTFRKRIGLSYTKFDFNIVDLP